MKVFVFSFGSIEYIDGILIVDTSLKFKTFEKEYEEIISPLDKSIKKVLKQAFDKGEFALNNDATLEQNLLATLERLEKYDKPSFNFIESFQTSNTTPSSSKNISPVEETPDLDDDELIDDSPLTENVLEDEEALYESQELPSDTLLEDQVDLLDEGQPDTASSLFTVADLQDTLTFLKDPLAFEEPAVIDEPIEESSMANIEEPVEETPISEVEAHSTGIISSFLIQLTEEADFKLDPDLAIKKSDISGKILLKNEGKQDRIWDINLTLGNIKTTSLKENSFHLNELNPGEIWEENYKVKEKKQLPITFKETIDTAPTISDEINNLVPNQKTTIEFSFYLENLTNHDIINFKMEKQIPKAFTDLKLLNEIPPKTEVKFQNDILSWKILTLKPKQVLTLDIQATIIPKTDASIKTGSIQISYTSINSFYSDIILEDISSISKNMYYIEKDEQEKNPGQWTCRLILENKSEFPILLESAEIFSGHLKSEQKTTVFRAINEIIRPSDVEWISKDWTVVSKAIPTFGKKLQFKIIPTTVKSFSANISIEEKELPILWAEVRKIYNISEVASYTNTPLEVKSLIINKGNAEINQIKIKESIPENFTPPALKNIKLFIDGKELDTSKIKGNFSFKKEPDNDDTSIPHQIIIEILNLKDSVGSLKQNSELILEYLITAVNPPPEKIYTFPINVTCDTIPVGIPLEITPDMVENSEIKVTHKRRKLTVGKSVFPGSTEGEYEILIMFKNRGNTRIENATISDLIPTNFKVVSAKPEATSKEVESETVLEWNFDVIEPGKKVEISYKIKGSGEYKTSEAEIFHKV